MHAKQTTNRGVHGGFPQLRGVHLAQAFVTLTAGGALGFTDEPMHGLAKVVGLFFFLSLAFTAHDFGAFTQQAAEGVGRFSQSAIVGTVHEILRDDAALDVAMMPAADAQQGLVGSHVKLSAHFGRNAGGVEFAQFGLQCGGAFSSEI